VPPTAVALGVGKVDDIRKCVTTDAKRRGNGLYILGKTGAAMGGSLFYHKYKGRSRMVPDTDSALSKAMVEALVTAIESGLVASCHDISDGGLAVSAAEMCMGGNMGAELDIGAIGKLAPQARLFSEGPARWLLEVTDKSKKTLEARLRRFGLARLGTFSGDVLKISDGKRRLVELSVGEARKAWSSALWKAMG
jgi:phosphoribosylformylglycinamidine (FGAM) synthase-like enzyme